ncbi:DNA gyrase subunit B [Kitasatospora sp. NPDC088391]|uniref:DNA gyrase subunit B n=1 Tax=Kitasatospora sp. NPDC088391 TaxID=3364074 RepID=UPI003812AC7D
MSAGDTARYDASAIVVLSGLESVRHRAEWYVGPLDERGRDRLALNAVEEAANEILLGRGSRTDVTLLTDGRVRVEHDAVHASPLEQELTLLRAGCGPGDRRLVGRDSSGLAVLSALSERLVAVERRDGVTVRHTYARGEQTLAPTVTGPADRTSTTLTFRPDPEIFGPTAPTSFDTLAERLRELAFLNRELDFTLTGDGRSARFHSPGGLREFVAHLGGDPGDTVLLTGVDERIGADCAVAFSRSGAGGLRGYANSVRTPAGTHLEGFRDGLHAALLPYAGCHALRGALAALSGVVAVRLDLLRLRGPGRDRLAEDPVRDLVATAVRSALERRFAEHPERATELLRPR